MWFYLAMLLLFSGCVAYSDKVWEGPNPLPTEGTAKSGGAVIPAEEVAKHNTLEDCWIIVGDGVYDVTSYVGEHPGGVEPIRDYCGKNATEAFMAIHSESAKALLESFRIGTVSGTMAPDNQSYQRYVGGEEYEEYEEYGEEYEGYEEYEHKWWEYE